ncbi:hypothetical protein HYR54_07355 [Candidatus Acetothermia bacterium]|nr:hypothetical protein [Candidatus Acetothermia bacterium]MBI3661302.1 hypothetical protein [Candidatus Acetothermia bacterium]
MSKTLQSQQATIDPREFDSRHVQFVVDRFYKTAKHIPAERFDWKPQSEHVKSAHEMLRHIVEGNHILIHSLSERKPLSPSLLSEEERKHIQAETTNYEMALEALRTSGQKVAELVESIPIELLQQDEMARLVMASIVHMSYHWGQLCYLQTMWGDMENYR